MNGQLSIQETTDHMEDPWCPEIVLATSISAISITEIATATERPDQVLGTNFFNPVPVTRLVEIV